MKASPLQDSFNAGEFSPLMSARVRIDKYRNALSTCLNMVPLVQGGVTRRSGTMFVAAVPESDYVVDGYVVDGYIETVAETRLVPFEFNVTQAYVIAFSSSTIRFFKDRGVVELSPGSAYEIASPYGDVDLFELKFTQSADVLYITHQNHAPRKLSRTGDTAWTLEEIDFIDGPYLPTNATDTTLELSSLTGSTVVTASSAVFSSGDVGRPIRFKSTGTTWGWMKITAYTSATQVTAEIQRSPEAVDASVDWRLGVWSSDLGYPSCVTFFEDRLAFAGSTSYPQRIDLSKSGDYENFAPTADDGTIGDDNAIGVTLNASDVNVIRWMIDDEKGLLIGSVGGEWILRPSSLSEALTPTNIAAKRSTTFGSADLQAVRAGKSAVYIQRASRKVRELAYVYEVDGFRSPDMTVMSEHITKGGIKQFDYQQEPHSILWFVRNDGVLLGMTYERDQDVVGWHRHIIGGSYSGGNAVVESVCCIPTPSGDADETWLVVKRTIDSQTVRHIEYIAPYFDEDSTTWAHFLDSGLEYDGTPVTTITGLGHLEGETVTILSDGATHPDRVVTSGEITLVRAASIVHVGLPYDSDVKTLNIEAGAADGTAQGKTKRIHRVVVRLYKTLGLKFGPSSSQLDVLPFRTTADPMGSPPALFTGDKQVNWNGNYETEGVMFFRQNQPLPFTLLGVFPQVVTQDR
jgi:hypothetical protein